MQTMNWTYERDDSTFDIIPTGEHRIRIASVEMTTSQSGNDMLSFKFAVSGCPSFLFHNIVFLKDRPQITNRNLTRFFDAFPGIPEGEKNISQWMGKVGACVVKHEHYNGKIFAKIDSFIPASKQDSLPPWKESNGATIDSDGFVNMPAEADEIPFTF